MTIRVIKMLTGFYNLKSFFKLCITKWQSPHTMPIFLQKYDIQRPDGEFEEDTGPAEHTCFLILVMNLSILFTTLKM